jgi:glycosyltransferase involved in cell wall biosynthesis
MGKILFITIVPPFPADQGNRVYTKTFMDYLVSEGYKLDVLMQTGYDRKAFKEHFGSSATPYDVKPSNYPSKEIVENRQNIKKLISNLNLFKGYDSKIHMDLFYAANNFHPFEFISDDMINKARHLLEKNKYEYIICNYIYSLRVVHELKYLLNGAKTIVITIDAVSRLNALAYNHQVFTSHRACSPETEAECLSVADKVLAISGSEYNYFHDIGVDAEIKLCEYNSFDWLEKDIISRSNFKNKNILFVASGNQLNVIGLTNYLNKVWPGLYHTSNGATLTICGGVCEHFNINLKNVEFLGKVSSDQLRDLTSKASLSINPVDLGTGLKIKSVESMCIGLPMVTFNEGVDGLQQFQNKAFILVDNWLEFYKQNLALLNDFELWESIRKGAVEVACNRFTSKVVFKDVLN